MVFLPLGLLCFNIGTDYDSGLVPQLVKPHPFNLIRNTIVLLEILPGIIRAGQSKKVFGN